MKHRLAIKRKIILTWVVLVLGVVVLVACGKKTAPIPPQAVIPAPVADLAYQLDKNGVTLSWSPPEVSEQGAGLPAIDKFLVERAVYDLGNFCADCPVRYTELFRIGEFEDGGKRQKITFREENLRPGHIYFYRVSTKLGWRVVSRPSKAVSFRWQLAVSAPDALRGLAGDRRVALTWQAPADDLDGALVDGPLQYQVFRSVTGGDFIPLGDPVVALTYTDQQVENGLSYLYKIRAARLSGGTGIFSDMVEVSPRDLTPPPAPQGLSLIDTPVGVRIFWKPLAVADLGGYLILRRSAESGFGQAFKVIGRVVAPLTSFIDKNPCDHETCYYALKAFDSVLLANEGPMSDEVIMQRNR